MTKDTTASKEDQYEEDDFNSSTVIPDHDYCRLRSNWVLELQSPELMPYDTELVSLEMELLEAQEDALDTIQSKDFMDILMSQVYRLDLERTKFILSDLLTTRLNKLEDHVFHNRTQIHRMSDYEVSGLGM
jgi:GINS complex protein